MVSAPILLKEDDPMKHKPFGLTHPLWDRPDCFYYDTAEEAAHAAVRTYGANSGHIVVGAVAPSTQSPSDADLPADARKRVIAAIHGLEASEADPTVEQYADAALAALRIVPRLVCTCLTDPLDWMPLVDGRCPEHSPAGHLRTPPATPDADA